MKWWYDCKMRFVLIGTVTSGFLGMTSVCLSVEYIWTNKTDMPTARWNFATCETNGKIYAFAGQPSETTGVGVLYTVEEYDPVLDVWTSKALRSRMMTCTDASAINGKIYVIDGYDSHMEMYDPSADTWTNKADMPTSRRFFATSAVNGKIYVIGGTPPPDTYSGLTTMEEYDPLTDTWTRKSEMPVGRWALGANVVNEKIYVFGGRLGLTALPNLYEYDPVTDIWTRKADMLVGTSQMASIVIRDKIIVIGGWNWSADFPYTTIQKYDPKADIWTEQADAPFLRAAFSAEVVGDRIFIIGGTDRPHPCPAFSTVFEFGPLFDFNWDGIVDSADMCLLVENWHTDNQLCDIAPLPFGDDIVDVRDLIDLSEHFFEEICPVALIGHWKFDEYEGDVAHNSISDNHGVLCGNPVWQPDKGQVVGALEFDGIDDYVSTESVLNPAEGAFSVLAWIKGGAPGQTVLSQANVSNWLSTDPVEGWLMTELKSSGRSSAGPILSQVDITGENWHRIGLIWDGLYRYLYVDGSEIAKDAAPLSSLQEAGGGLYFGVGHDLSSSTFFSGLIDDVRIYNRAVKL